MLLEGEDYIIKGYSNPYRNFSWGRKPSFRLFFGGIWDIHFTKYNDNISVTKPTILFQNFVSSGYSRIDIEGNVEAVSHSTGSRVEAEFTLCKEN